VPIFTVEEFNSQLNIQMKNSSNLITYLTDIFLIKSIHNSSTETYILPLYSLEDSPSKDRFESVWPVNWYGHEIRTSIKFYVPVPFAVFRQVLSKFFSLEKSVLAWKCGLVNRESGCFVLVRLDGRDRLLLEVRILNPELQFNLATKAYLLYSHFVFMDYLMEIKVLLAKTRLPIDVSLKFSLI